MKTLTFNNKELYVLHTWLQDLDKMGRVTDRDREYYSGLLTDTNVELPLDAAFDIFWDVTEGIAEGEGEDAEEAKNELLFKEICRSFVLMCQDEEHSPRYFLEKIRPFIMCGAYNAIEHFLDQYDNYRAN